MSGEATVVSMAQLSALKSSDDDGREAQSLIRRCAEPRLAGEMVRLAIARVSRRLKWPLSRTRDLWYGAAKRIDASEMDRLRREADKIEKTKAAAYLRARKIEMEASNSLLARELIAGLDTALRAFGADCD